MDPSAGVYLCGCTEKGKDRDSSGLLSESPFVIFLPFHAAELPESSIAMVPEHVDIVHQLKLLDSNERYA